jgi:restriction system protein
VALGADEGIDLALQKDDERLIVQCKHWQCAKVSLAVVREFAETVAAAGNGVGGLLITTGKFTRDAAAFAAGKPITLINGDALNRHLRTAQRPGENLCDSAGWMQEFVAAAQWLDPVCPVCRASMVSRAARDAGAPFWGCTSFPRCNGKRGARRDLHIARMPGGPRGQVVAAAA